MILLRSFWEGKNEDRKKSKMCVQSFRLLSCVHLSTDENSLNLICSKKKCYNGISRRCWLSRTHKINRLEAVIRHGQYKNPIKYLHNLQTRTQKKYIMIYGVLGEKLDKYQAAYEIEVCLRNPLGISLSFGE